MSFNMTFRPTTKAKLEHFFIIACFTFLLNTGTCDALKCLNCAAVAHPFLCKHVTTCYDNEKCGMETFISQDGSRLYSVGCVHRDTCAAGTNIMTNGGPVFSSCHSCCDDHDLCNVRGCNASGFPINRGPVCYNCEASPAGFTCPTISYCEQHEVCFNDASLEFLSETLYTSGCRSKHHCATDGFDPLTSFVGKRDGDSGTENRLAANKRTLQVCTDCCEGDLCNVQCKRTDTCHDDSDCATLMASLPNLCSNHDLATKFCQRTCNMCPSATGDSCGDLRVNCMHINQTLNVCGTKLKAYEYGCLKHCGYCSSQSTPATVTSVHPPGTTTSSGITTRFPIATYPATQPPTSLKKSTLPTQAPTPSSTTVISTKPSPITAVTTSASTPSTPGSTSRYTQTTQGTFRASTSLTTVGSTFPLHPVFIPHTHAPGTTSTGSTNATPSTLPLLPVFIPHTQAPGTSTVAQTSPVYTIGSRVVRGSDWKGGNEDGNGEGTIVDTSVTGVVTVVWDNGQRHTYNMGRNGEYELAVMTTSATPTPMMTTTSHTFTTTSAIASPQTNGLQTTGVSSYTAQGTGISASMTLGVSTSTASVTRNSTTQTASQQTTVTMVTVTPTTGVSSVNAFFTNNVTQPASTTQQSTATIIANCPLKPPEIQHGYPAQVQHGFMIYKCYDGYTFQSGGQNNSRQITCNVVNQTWTQLLPTCVPIRFCAVSTDCLNNGSCDMNRRACSCTPGYFNTNCDSEFRLGDVVVRGPDWMWGDQDGNGTGTVILLSQPGWVRVHWANTNRENAYRFGKDGKYDIMPYNGTYIVPNLLPLVLSSTISTLQSTVSTTTSVPLYGPELMAKMCIGCRVQRGRDWKWGDQDDNGLGTVLEVNTSGGWVKVEWDNGRTNVYRMGSENAYDLMLAP